MATASHVSGSRRRRSPPRWPRSRWTSTPVRSLSPGSSWPSTRRGHQPHDPAARWRRHGAGPGLRAHRGPGARRGRPRGERGLRSPTGSSGPTTAADGGPHLVRRPWSRSGPFGAKSVGEIAIGGVAPAVPQRDPRRDRASRSTIAAHARAGVAGAPRSRCDGATAMDMATTRSCEGTVVDGSGTRRADDALVRGRPHRRQWRRDRRQGALGADVVDAGARTCRWHRRAHPSPRPSARPRPTTSSPARSPRPVAAPPASSTLRRCRSRAVAGGTGHVARPGARPGTGRLRPPPDGHRMPLDPDGAAQSGSPRSSSTASRA